MKEMSIENHNRFAWSTFLNFSLLIQQYSIITQWWLTHSALLYGETSLSLAFHYMLHKSSWTCFSHFSTWLDQWRFIQMLVVEWILASEKHIMHYKCRAWCAHFSVEDILMFKETMPAHGLKYFFLGNVTTWCNTRVYKVLSHTIFSVLSMEPNMFCSVLVRFWASFGTLATKTSFK